VEAINYVAAAFSTPALPTPVASAGTPTFYRPLLPSAPTNFTIVHFFKFCIGKLENQ
jgi:hypothetical protein